RCARARASACRRSCPRSSSSSRWSASWGPGALAAGLLSRPPRKAMPTTATVNSRTKIPPRPCFMAASRSEVGGVVVDGDLRAETVRIDHELDIRGRVDRAQGRDRLVHGGGEAGELLSRRVHGEAADLGPPSEVAEDGAADALDAVRRGPRGPDATAGDGELFAD